MATLIRRPSLEPLVPAVTGIALAHLLAGFLVWTFLPLWSAGKGPLELTRDQTALVWMSPADFLPPAAPSDPAALSQPPAAAPPPAPTPAQMPPPQQVAPAPAPPPAAPTLVDSAQLTPPPTTGPGASPAEPSAPGAFKAANKYISISAVLPESGVAAPPSTPAKAVLNLMDIAAINASERTRQQALGGADMSAVETALQEAILREWAAPPLQMVPAGRRQQVMELAVARDGTVLDATVAVPSNAQPMDVSVKAALGRVKKIPVTLPSRFPKERYVLRVNFLIE